jgi:hypothetical protein
MVRWNDLTLQEQQAIKRIMQGHHTSVSHDDLKSLENRGLAEAQSTGMLLNAAGKQLYRTAHTAHRRGV